MVIVILFKHAWNSDRHSKIKCMVMLNFLKNNLYEVTSAQSVMCPVIMAGLLRYLICGVEMLPLNYAR